MAASYLRRAAGLVLGCVLLGSVAPRTLAAQDSNSQAVFLVARNEIQDPFFSHSVVLMLPIKNSPMVVGLIVNKPTRMTLGKLFPDSPALQSRTEHAYFGGPVDVGVPCAVFHTSNPPEHALRVYGNVYLTFDSDSINNIFQNAPPNSTPHLFLGRAQWAPGQLENEIARGSWYRVQAQGDLIFGSNIQGLWRKLHDQAAPSKYIQYRLPANRSHAKVLTTALSD